MTKTTILTDKRKRAISKFWNDVTKIKSDWSMSNWQAYCEHFAEAEDLAWARVASDGHPKRSLEFVARIDTYAKIKDGYYSN